MGNPDETSESGIAGKPDHLCGKSNSWEMRAAFDTKPN
jgi:hypothetical protein